MYRLKRIRMENEEEKDRECIFKPELSTRIDISGIKEVKGVNKFIERQKIATEARKEKEACLNKNQGQNWVKRVTIPEGFSFTNSVKYIVNIGKEK